MEQIDFITIYRSQTFQIIDGPHEGKLMFLAGIDYASKTVTTKSGTVLPAEVIRPLLRPIEDINDTEGYLLYRRYWGKETADDWGTVVESITPAQVKPTREHALRILEGRDYIAGDFEEWMSVIDLLISCGFDIFKGAERGWAITKKR